MRKVITTTFIIFVFIFAIGGFFYLKAQETVEQIVLGVKTVRLQNAQISDVQNTLPTADVVGDDLGLARYPASTRTAYVKKDAATMAAYQVKAISLDVLKFYEAQLIQNNWGEVSNLDSKMVFVQDDNKLTILANTNSLGLTTFEIILEKF